MPLTAAPPTSARPASVASARSRGRVEVVGVVGAGAAGTLTAVALLRRATELGVALRVELYDDRPDTGRGVAYGTSDDRHLLNVPAARMGAHPDAPDDFVRWLGARSEAATAPAPGDGELVAGGPVGAGGPAVVGVAAGPATGGLGASYVPRATYGRYLDATLVAAAGAPGPARLHRVHRRVTGIASTAGGVLLRSADGSTGPVDAVVLALGVAEPSPSAVPPAVRRWPGYLADPWAPGALATVPADDAPVLLVGTGLTMVDVALSLAGAGRRIVAVSRTGLLPRAHRPGPAACLGPPALPPGPLRLDALRAAVTAHVRASIVASGDWRPAVDGLRPVSAELWQRLAAADRAQFLRRDARRWEVLRHRMAPQVAAALGRLRADGQLQVRRARAVDAAAPASSASSGHLRVRLDDGSTMCAGWVVNCTGPQTDVRRLADPLVQDLLAQGLARPDPLRLGFDVDEDGRLVGRDGRVDPRVVTVGAARRGRTWESTAVPELRGQAAAAAALLLPGGSDVAGAAAPNGAATGRRRRAPRRQPGAP